MDPYTEVYTWGSNSYGQMGLESSSGFYSVPRICAFGVVIQQVACGNEHSALLSNQHYVYCMGSNSDGRLGVGDKNIANSSYPLLVESLAGVKVTQVSCGGFHSAAITHEGDLYTWGKGAMLGHSDLVTRWTPCKLDLDLTFVIQVSCGESHSGIVCIKNKEKICMTWGNNTYGQLGINSDDNSEKPVRSLVSDIKELACGSDFSLFLTNSGQVLSCGKNNLGQLGLNSTQDQQVPKKIKSLDGIFINKIAAGGLATCVTEEGLLYVWGDSILVPKQVRGCPKDIKEVSVGEHFFTALTRTNILWTWGDNSYGQLGVGDSSDKRGLFIVESLKKKRVKQVACGKDFVIVLGEDMKQVDLRKDERRAENSERKRDHKRNTKEQFWSSERNETETEGNLYESALKKMNFILAQKDKQLEMEKEMRLKNEEYKKVYFELEGKLQSMMKNFECERAKREEQEIMHSRNEGKLLQIIREKEAEVLRLRNENKGLRNELEKRQPCSTCINIINEFQGLKQKNESLLSELVKQSPNKKPNFDPDNSGAYIPQSPSFDKSLDKSIDRHKLINNQLKISRSESELLKLIDEKTNKPVNTERTGETKLPLLRLDFDKPEEFALPTFRGQENSFSMQKNLKNSIADIKARINTLNSSRSELQSKMEELENKLVKSTQRYYV